MSMGRSIHLTSTHCALTQKSVPGAMWRLRCLEVLAFADGLP